MAFIENMAGTTDETATGKTAAETPDQVTTKTGEVKTVPITKFDIKNVQLSDLSPARYLLELINEIPVVGVVIGFPMTKINRLAQVAQVDPKAAEFSMLATELFRVDPKFTTDHVQSVKRFVDREISVIKTIEAALNFIMILLAIYVLAHFVGLSEGDDATDVNGEDTIVLVDAFSEVDGTQTNHDEPLTVDEPFQQLQVEAVSPVTPVSETPAVLRTTYTVQPGDNLTKIASLFDVTVDQLYQWNRDKIYNIDMIRVGWELTVSP